MDESSYFAQARRNSLRRGFARVLLSTRDSPTSTTNTDSNFTMSRARRNLVGFSRSDNANALNRPAGFPDLCARDCYRDGARDGRLIVSVTIYANSSRDAHSLGFRSREIPTHRRGRNLSLEVATARVTMSTASRSPATSRPVLFPVLFGLAADRVLTTRVFAPLHFRACLDASRLRISLRNHQDIMGRAVSLYWP